MNSKEYTAKVKILAADNKKHTAEFVPMPEETWPQSSTPIIRVMRNNKFLVQIFQERSCIRLTICRTMIGRDGRWLDGITWDELQWVKNAVGYGSRDAFEVYPKHNNVVDVANMRHLWIPDQTMDFVWRGI